jgi:cation diffusion facilitator family transporter
MNRNNFRKVRQVLWTILLLNLAVAFLKIVVGTFIKSTSIMADGLHSLTDGSSNIVGLIGIRLAAKPVDKEHPYGHKKFETLAALFISIMLAIISTKIIFDAVKRFLNPISPKITTESIIVIIVTLIVNIIICYYEYKIGKTYKSEILITDSMHTKSDIYVSIGVLITIISIKLGLPAFIDPMISLIISGFILHTAYEIFDNTSAVLVDRATVDTEIVKKIVMSFTHVKDAHKIRSRGKEDDMYIDMHIMLDPKMSVEESHKLIHDIERKVKEELHENTQTIIHIEPFKE